MPESRTATHYRRIEWLWAADFCHAGQARMAGAGDDAGSGPAGELGTAARESGVLERIEFTRSDVTNAEQIAAIAELIEQA